MTKTQPKFLNEPIYQPQRKLSVIVIGAGASGLFLTYKLQRHFGDIEIKVFEKNAGVSGTWFENVCILSVVFALDERTLCWFSCLKRYPGCACDIPAHSKQLYSPKFYNGSFWPIYGIKITPIPLNRIPNSPPATRVRLRSASTLLISVLDTALRSTLPYSTKLPRSNGKRKRQNGGLMCKICRQTQHSNTLRISLWTQVGISTIGHGLIYQVYTLSKARLYTARHGTRVWISLGRLLGWLAMGKDLSPPLSLSPSPPMFLRYELNFWQALLVFKSCPPFELKSRNFTISSDNHNGLHLQSMTSSKVLQRMRFLDSNLILHTTATSVARQSGNWMATLPHSSGDLRCRM